MILYKKVMKAGRGGACNLSIQRQKDGESDVSLGYLAGSHQKERNKNQKTVQLDYA